MRTLLTSITLGLVVVAGVPATSAQATPEPPGRTQAAERAPKVPTHLYGGAWPTSHVQGVAVDRRKGFVYYSFTQMLVKTDFQGRVVGTVEGLTGHLGDLDRNRDDGRIYGSLEYKAAESFYIAIFDGDKIDRMGMDAESDGVMTTVYLKEVVKDFTADMDHDGVFDGDVADTADHRYGCSGIDGVSFGPEPGRKGGRNTLLVAYGIYANTARTDNDHQVLLAYDVRAWKRYEKPLAQEAPHTSGPRRVGDKLFVRTGNTTYGVQNLEYDPYTHTWMMAVYTGTKTTFPNYSLFMVDAHSKPRRGPISGQPRPERGNLLPLLPYGLYDSSTGIHGWQSAGNTGLEALGDGTYYIATGKAVTEDGIKKQNANLDLHHWTGQTPNPFGTVTAES